MTDAHKHPVHKRVWWWLRTGHAAPPGRGYFTWLRDPSPWTRPWRAWQVLLRRRRTFSPPLFYIILFALGSVVGIILHLTLDFSWWIIPVILVVLAWLWFFSTIWFGRGPQHGVPLRDELLAVFKPEEAHARTQTRMRAEINSSQLRFFGPIRLQHMTPDLGWSGSGGIIESISLTFVEHATVADHVQVLCIVQTLQRQAGEESVRQEVRSHIMSEALKQVHETSHPIESEEEYQARYEAIVPESLRGAENLRWSSTEMIIDADRIAAHTTTSHGLRFTYGKFDDEWVLVTEQLEAWPGADRVMLAEISDREPLVERMFESWHG